MLGRPPSRFLAELLGFDDDRVHEAALAVGAVAEGLVRGLAAAAQRELLGRRDLVAVLVDDAHPRHQIGAVVAYLDRRAVGHRARSSPLHSSHGGLASPA